MPAPARKSSIGVRRPPMKYVPYRGDDLGHGKKTGIAVAYVDHKSDEFEPFDKVISQADARTPPRVQNARKRRATPKPKTPIIEEYDDENGEMSMELEDSTANSPSAYFAHAHVRSITSSVQRVGSASRPVASGSDVDFDKVPSPRPAFASSRRSSVRGAKPGPSHLSRSIVAENDEDEPMDEEGIDTGAGVDYDAGRGYDDDSENEPLASPSPGPSAYSQRKNTSAVSRRTSFAQIDHDDEEEEPEPVESPRSKGKRRDTGHYSHYEPEPEPDIQDDLSQAMGDFEAPPMDMDMDVDMDAEEPELPKKSSPKKRTKDQDDSLQKEAPAKKKAKGDNENEGAKKPRGRPKGSRKENVLREVLQDENIDGLRRGQRARYKPLEWWRCEKVVYGRRDGGISLVPTIKEIIRIPKEDPEPLGAKHRKKSRMRSKSKPADERVDPAELQYNPEEGWDDETEQNGPVLDWPSGRETERRVAFTAKMVNPKPAANNDFYFQKIFGDGDFIAAGQLIIPPNKTKPTKGTKDNTFVFYVIEGAVNFKVHERSFILATGGMFLVPRGNLYHIQNISDRDARLFFAQARKVAPEEDDDETLSRRSREHSSSTRAPSEAKQKSAGGKRANSAKTS